MQAIPLNAEERELLGKKVKQLRRVGLIPGHVYGNKVETEHVTVPLGEFLKVLKTAGETGLIDLKIGAEKTRPVLIRGMHMDPISGQPVHIDFYQVNLKENVTVPVPIVLIGDQPEIVHTGEAVVIQPLLEVEVEALPTDLPENIEVDITVLKAIDDTILVSQLQVPQGVTILADAEAVVAKLDNAVTEEMQQLLEEQEAEQAAATEAAAEEGAEGTVEGEEGAEGETAPEGGEAEQGSEGGGNDQGDSGKQGDNS